MQNQTVESMALVLHKLGDRMACVVHGFQPDPSGRLIMGAGKPLSRKVERSVAAILAGKESRRAGFIPECALVCDPGMLVWYRKPQLTILNLNDDDAQIQTPGLVFKLEDGELSVVAVKGKSRPVLATPIFHSGLPNISEGGHWCSGGNILPSQPAFSDIEKIERTFFKSPFTHHSGSPLNCGKSPWDFWLKGARVKPFPSTALVAIKTHRKPSTVAEFIDGECDD